MLVATQFRRLSASAWLCMAFVCTALLFLPSSFAFAQSDITLPRLTERVVDQANLLDAATKQSLIDQLAAHETQTSNQIIVVTVNSLEGLTDSAYAYRLGSEWGIGTEEKNNGVILLVAPNERKVRIEVGYGLEGALPDGLAGQIIRRDILPQFKEQDYESGIQLGINSILQAVVGEYEPEALGSNSSSKNPHRLFDYIPLLFIAIVAVPAILRRKGFYRVSNAALPGSFAGLAATLVSTSILLGLAIGIAAFTAVYFLNPNAGRKGRGSRRNRTRNVDDHDRHGPGGGFGGGSFGGGFSGGGGGGFGGGGASGSW